MDPTFDQEALAALEAVLGSSAPIPQAPASPAAASAFPAPDPSLRSVRDLLAELDVAPASPTATGTRSVRELLASIHPEPESRRDPPQPEPSPAALPRELQPGDVPAAPLPRTELPRPRRAAEPPLGPPDFVVPERKGLRFLRLFSR